MADFQAHITQFEQENVDIIALSVDSLDKAKVGATFPIGYGLTVPEDADKVGAYWKERRQIIHATNFIIDSDKKVTRRATASVPSAASSPRMRYARSKGQRKEKRTEASSLHP